MDDGVGFIAQIGIRIGEIDEVEDIENIPFQFERKSFTQPRRFLNAQVNTLLRRSAQDVSAQISETAARRKQRTVRV